VSFADGEDHHHGPTLTIDDTLYVDTYIDESGHEHKHSFDVLSLDMVDEMKAFSVEKDHHSDDLRIKLGTTLTYSLVNDIPGLTLN